ncbi:hypothetical protein AB205_0157140 [Aquarana catesbeiana]|uniref:Uncharacterized protein n=1 Tax=Aquarana catesbeiana TaxID=8400 RepID=A0A2G9RFI9_AQUCT|nr:hypothetical protein AB205_0157140 [Aquarana catesbeiana]
MPSQLVENYKSSATMAEGTYRHSFTGNCSAALFSISDSGCIPGTCQECNCCIGCAFSQTVKPPKAGVITDQSIKPRLPWLKTIEGFSSTLRPHAHWALRAEQSSIALSIAQCGPWFMGSQRFGADRKHKCTVQPCR